MSGQKLTPIEIDQIIAKTNYCLLYHYDKNMLMFAISETKLNFIIKGYLKVLRVLTTSTYKIFTIRHLTSTLD